MSQRKSLPITTPICEFEWVTISGDGKDDLNGVPHFWVTCLFDPDRVDKENTSERRAKEHKAFLQTLEDFWTAEKPKGKYEVKGGVKPHKVKTDEVDENGDPVYKETGKFAIVVKTRTKIENKKTGKVSDKVIKVFNAQGAEVSLGTSLIGNGSRGRIGLTLTTFVNAKANTIISSGLSFYLNTLQLVKFVPYEGATMGAVDEEDCEEGEDFAGTGEMGGITEHETEESDESEQKQGPRI